MYLSTIHFNELQQAFKTVLLKNEGFRRNPAAGTFVACKTISSKPVTTKTGDRWTQKKRKKKPDEVKVGKKNRQRPSTKRHSNYRVGLWPW